MSPCRRERSGRTFHRCVVGDAPVTLTERSSTLGSLTVACRIPPVVAARSRLRLCGSGWGQLG